MNEYVKVTSSNTGKSIDARFVELVKSNLKVWIETSDTVFILRQEGGEYIGRALGLEFTSDGKVFKK